MAKIIQKYIDQNSNPFYIKQNYKRLAPWVHTLMLWENLCGLVNPKAILQGVLTWNEYEPWKRRFIVVQGSWDLTNCEAPWTFWIPNWLWFLRFMMWQGSQKPFKGNAFHLIVFCKPHSTWVKSEWRFHPLPVHFWVNWKQVNSPLWFHSCIPWLANKCIPF